MKCILFSLRSGERIILYSTFYWAHKPGGKNHYLNFGCAALQFILHILSR